MESPSSPGQFISGVANNYGGAGRSFSKLMQRLDTTSRSLADAYLHEPIKSRETLPNRTQVNFTHELDRLLEEIVRLLK